MSSRVLKHPALGPPSQPNRRLGRIAPGWQADFVLYDAPDYRHIPYHYGRNHVRATVKRGRVVHRRADPSICH